MINFELLSFNLTNPTLLFFILGVFAKYVKSDLEVPAASKNFISLYLLFSIGFNGGLFSGEGLYGLRQACRSELNPPP
jgi:hypothetical protein